MSKYTADEVDELACAHEARQFPFSTTSAMLRDLASRLRQEEEENRRDPVMDPRPGDWIQTSIGAFVWIEGAITCREMTEQVWLEASKRRNSTIIRRREVQQ